MSVDFRRGHACEHDPHRECTACFLGHVRPAFEAIFGGDFSEAWATRTIVGPEDGVDSFECFARFE